MKAGIDTAFNGIDTWFGAQRAQLANLLPSPNTHTHTHTHTHTFFKLRWKKAQKNDTIDLFFLFCFIFVENIHMMIFAAFAFPDFQRQHCSKLLELFIHLFWFC